MIFLFKSIPRLDLRPWKSFGWTYLRTFVLHIQHSDLKNARLESVLIWFVGMFLSMRGVLRALLSFIRRRIELKRFYASFCDEQHIDRLLSKPIGIYGEQQIKHVSKTTSSRQYESSPSHTMGVMLENMIMVTKMIASNSKSVSSLLLIAQD